MKEIRFLKPIERMREGYMHGAVIGWDKRPYLQKTRNIATLPLHKGELVNSSDYNVEVYTAQWEYYIHINLWLVEINFSFLGKEHD